jgi:hypothetical protein
MHHDWHHRRPKSLGGTNGDWNMINVSASKHQAWHTLFKNYTPQQIVKVINDIWLDPDYYFVVRKKEIDHVQKPVVSVVLDRSHPTF